ncbi:MAG TPA: MBL fold metallo-hydrolase RNA specificity domain-containing protein, partial [Burkholderiales bacterium]|nr:MBL fold metallo-hydrolase RNA specificity domain-containing protein [Burkholderiales bacterium]
DQAGLVAWYRGFGKALPPVALVHGEPTAIDGLAARLKALRAPVIVPTPGARLDLVAGLPGR